MGETHPPEATEPKIGMKKSRSVVTELQRTFRTQEIRLDEAAETKAREDAKKNHDFVQFQRPGMKDFVGLIRRSPSAAQALIVMAAFMNRSNQIETPMSELCAGCGASRATMSRAIKRLGVEGWIQTTKVGSTNQYQVNSNIFWTTSRTFKFKGEFHAKISPLKDSTQESTDPLHRMVARYTPTLETSKKVSKEVKRGIGK